jgi:hypothetical protein
MQAETWLGEKHSRQRGQHLYRKTWVRKWGCLPWSDQYWSLLFIYWDLITPIPASSCSATTSGPGSRSSTVFLHELLPSFRGLRPQVKLSASSNAEWAGIVCPVMCCPDPWVTTKGLTSPLLQVSPTVTPQLLDGAGESSHLQNSKWEETSFAIALCSTFTSAQSQSCFIPRFLWFPKYSL